MLKFRCEWTGQPQRKHLAEYRQWVLYTTQLLAERWNERIGYALGVSPTCTEFWVFAPGDAPKLLKKLPFGL
jgi:hypothetical protein